MDPDSWGKKLVAEPLESSIFVENKFSKAGLRGFIFFLAYNL